MINTASIELNVELLYVLKKLLIKEYENDSANGLQETEYLNIWKAPTEGIIKNK
jgi:hypothetical protein